MTVAPLPLVFLAGEGRDELGSRGGHPNYVSGEDPGVIETLLRKVRQMGWEVGGAKEWRRARHLRVGRREHGDTHTVRVLALDADEAGCQILAFLRDRDQDMEREAAVRTGLDWAETKYPHLGIIGGVMVPVLEGWILALAGEPATDAMSKHRAQSLAAERDLDTLARMIAVTEAADVSHLPSGTVSLTAWVEQADRVLPR